MDEQDYLGDEWKDPTSGETVKLLPVADRYLAIRRQEQAIHTLEENEDKMATRLKKLREQITSAKNELRGMIRRPQQYLPFPESKARRGELHPVG